MAYTMRCLLLLAFLFQTTLSTPDLASSSLTQTSDLKTLGKTLQAGSENQTVTQEPKAELADWLAELENIHSLGNNETDPKAALRTLHRVKRGHGSCIPGLSLAASENAGEATRLNVAANDGGGRGRGKRSIDQLVRQKRGAITLRNPFAEFLSKLFRPRARAIQSGPRFLTRTQERFYFLNFNYGALQRFVRSPILQASESGLSDRIVLNPHGVTCDQLCKPHGTIFALVGFCTPDYCKCSKGGWEESWESQQEFSCHHGKIFDPVSLQCQDPRRTELCSDLKPRKYHNHVEASEWDWPPAPTGKGWSYSYAY